MFKKITEIENDLMLYMFIDKNEHDIIKDDIHDVLKRLAAIKLKLIDYANKPKKQILSG